MTFIPPVSILGGIYYEVMYLYAYAIRLQNTLTVCLLEACNRPQASQAFWRDTSNRAVPVKRVLFCACSHPTVSLLHY